MKLVLLRHGQSTYNLEKRFCGWTDVPLTEKGIIEAKNAGKLLKENNFSFDCAYTSVLKRAINTLEYVLDELEETIPVDYDWHLNERCYGALQGKTHKEMEDKYGKEQVHLWRRSYELRPPLLTEDDTRYPGNDLKYKDVQKEKLPFGESLEDTLKRTTEYFNKKIVPEILKDKDILVVAHGNSLRSLIKYLEKMSSDEIIKFELKTGIPYVYEIDKDLKIQDKYFLQ